MLRRPKGPRVAAMRVWDNKMFQFSLFVCSDGYLLNSLNEVDICTSGVACLYQNKQAANTPCWRLARSMPVFPGFTFKCGRMFLLISRVARHESLLRSTGCFAVDLCERKRYVVNGAAPFWNRVCMPAFFGHPQAGGNHKRVALWFVAGNARLSLNCRWRDFLHAWRSGNPFVRMITDSPRYARTVGSGADGGI